MSWCVFSLAAESWMLSKVISVCHILLGSPQRVVSPVHLNSPLIWCGSARIIAFVSPLFPNWFAMNILTIIKMYIISCVNYVKLYITFSWNNIQLPVNFSNFSSSKIVKKKPQNFKNSLYSDAGFILPALLNPSLDKFKNNLISFNCTKCPPIFNWVCSICLNVEASWSTRKHAQRSWTNLKSYNGWKS